MTEQETKNYNKNLAHMLSFASKVTSKKSKTPQVLLEVHKCPHCNTVARDMGDIKSLKAHGMCLQCDKHMWEARQEAKNEL